MGLVGEGQGYLGGARPRAYPRRTMRLPFISAARRGALVAAVAALLHASTFAAEFHITPSGNDENSGTSAKPFATLERGRDAVRSLKKQDGGRLPAGGVTVWI